MDLEAMLNGRKSGQKRPHKRPAAAMDQNTPDVVLLGARLLCAHGAKTMAFVEEGSCVHFCKYQLFRGPYYKLTHPRPVLPPYPIPRTQQGLSFPRSAWSETRIASCVALATALFYFALVWGNDQIPRVSRLWAFILLDRACKLFGESFVRRKISTLSQVPRYKTYNWIYL